MCMNEHACGNMLAGLCLPGQIELVKGVLCSNGSIVEDAIAAG